MTIPYNTAERPTKNSPIGIFDSGVGGLLVLKEITRLMPYEDIVYFGDTARLPYGSKSPSTIVRFSIENIVYLSSFHVKAVVVACNTATAIALDFLRNFIKIPIIGVVEPGAEAAVRATHSKEIGVIGTNTTVKMRAYTKALQELDPTIKVHEIATPLLVHLVEENWIDREITKNILREYLNPFIEKDPFLSKAIQEVLPNITLIDSAYETAFSVKRILKSEHLLAEKETPPIIRIYLSDFHPDSIKWATDFIDISASINQVEDFSCRS
jgi:glutamate racemase